MCYFTVFTPTYNRAYSLARVFDSLKIQTFKDFEWLIVDDGSTDNTRELVNQWGNQVDFPIIYIYQPNQGKHIAHNNGVMQAKGELFICFDSDDSCVPDALLIFFESWSDIPLEQRKEYAGVWCLCTNQFGELVGDKFPGNIFDGSLLDITFKYKVSGEKWWCFRTDVLRRYLFPSVKMSSHGIPYVPETTVWYAIGQHYQIRFINRALRTYWIEGRSDQTAGTTFLLKNAPGSATGYKAELNYGLSYWPFAPLRFLRSSIQFTRLSFLIGTSCTEQLKALHSRFARTVWFLTLLIGFCVYKFDTLRYSKNLSGIQSLYSHSLADQSIGNQYEDYKEEGYS